MRHSMVWGKTGRAGLQTDICRRRYKPNFLHLLISRKVLKSFIEISSPYD